MSSQPIAASANACLGAFQELLSSHVTAETEKIEQQLARFNFFAANIGVFAPHRASLDTRLSSRGGVKYRPLILQLLNVLEKNLRTASTAESPQAVKDVDREISYVDSLQAVQDLIDRLHRLSASIRKSAVRDRNSKAANFIDRDEDGNNLSVAFESNAFRIIQQRYPDASESLCRRLGESVSLRRRRILYNRRHQVKLAKRVPVLNQAPVALGNPCDLLPPRAVENHGPHEISMATGPLPEESVIALSVRPSETAASVPDSDVQSTIALSRASSASTGSMLQDQELRYPRAPKVDFFTSEASCPYCSAVLTVEESSNPKWWRRHVKRDIEPYLCVADSCKSHNSCFDNFKQWVMHMQQEHRIQWHCSLPVHPPISFEEKEQFEQHMLTDHKGKFNPLRLSTLAKIASRPALRPFDECPLCKVAFDIIDPIEGLARQPSGPDRLARHVAGHLKSLALVFLPVGDDDTEDETDSETSSTNKRSSRTMNSKDSIFEASLTFEGDDYVLPHWAPDVEAEEDWSLLSNRQHFDPKIDPILQSFVKHAQPNHRPNPNRNMVDWETFYKLTRGELQDIHPEEVFRQNILHEIVYTEDAYWHRLEVWHALYRDDLISWQPPIISTSKLPKFIELVFGGVDKLKLVNEVCLLYPLHQKQELEGPWISGFSDIFSGWLQAARQPYLNYAASCPNAAYLIQREKDRNILFRQFLDQAAYKGWKLSQRLSWDSFLHAPMIRVQRYHLLLETVLEHSQHIEEETEKVKLSAVINDLKEFRRELESVLSEHSKKVELRALINKLYLRAGIENVALHLDQPGRELILEGNLWRAGANPFAWVETHAILFDHYFLLTKPAIRDSAGYHKEEIYEVSKLPIPIELLVLLGVDDPPVVKSSFKIAVTTKSILRRTIPTADSPPHLSNAKSEPIDAMYPFHIKHLGRAETYVLYAHTAQNRRNWCCKIREAQERHATTLASQNTNPFRLKVLYVTPSSMSGIIIVRRRMVTANQSSDRTRVRVRGIPLDCALEEATSLRLIGGDLGTTILCADTYSRNGSQVLIIGTNKGIQTLDEGANEPRRLNLRVNMTDVTQIAVIDLPEFQLCLFIGNKSLWALPLEGLSRDVTFASLQLAPQKISSVRDVKSFAITTSFGDGRLLVFYKQQPLLSLQSSGLKILETIPTNKASWASTTTSAFNRLLGGDANISGLFHDLGNIDLPRDFTHINIFHPLQGGFKPAFISVSDSAGFTILRRVLDMRKEAKEEFDTVPNLKSPSTTTIAVRVKGQNSLAMFQLPNDEFLVCYSECGVYVDRDGEVSRNVIIEFISAAESAAMFDKYLVLFHQEFVEIRNIDNGGLKQVIYGEDIKCLDDGNRGSNTQGRKRSLKFAMAHPDDPKRHLVLEMLLVEDIVD